MLIQNRPLKPGGRKVSRSRFSPQPKPPPHTGLLKRNSFCSHLSYMLLLQHQHQVGHKNHLQVKQSSGVFHAGSLPPPWGFSQRNLGTPGPRRAGRRAHAQQGVRSFWAVGGRWAVFGGWGCSTREVFSGLSLSLLAKGSPAIREVCPKRSPFTFANLPG